MEVPCRYYLLVVPSASVGTFIELRWMTLRLAAREHSVAKVLGRLIPNAYSLDSRVYAVVLKLYDVELLRSFWLIRLSPYSYIVSLGAGGCYSICVFRYMRPRYTTEI